MNTVNTCILTINCGSSSIKFALFQIGNPLDRSLHGKVDRIGLADTNLTYNDQATNQPVNHYGRMEQSVGCWIREALKEMRTYLEKPSRIPGGKYKELSPESAATPLSI